MMKVTDHEHRHALVMLDALTKPLVSTPQAPAELIATYGDLTRPARKLTACDDYGMFHVEMTQCVNRPGRLCPLCGFDRRITGCYVGHCCA